MKKIKSLYIFMIFIILTVFVFANPVSAQDKIAADLQKQIEELQKRVEELESEKRQQHINNNSIRRNRTWNSFEEIYRMQEEMDRMFQDSFKARGGAGGGVLSSNMSYDENFEIKDKKDRYIFELDMKGLNQDKTSIDINENSITIKGERSSEEKKESKSSYMSSTSFSSFMRTIPLPADADTSKIKSDKESDKLIITLPKKK